MKVMKFGGTSVGSVKSILSLKKIVETEARTQPVIVVVSALDGITDKLIATSQMAKQGDEHYREEFDAMVKRHHQMIDTIITDDKKRVDLFNNVDQLFDQLKSIYYGVYLIHDLSKKTEDTIVSYGERLSICQSRRDADMRFVLSDYQYHIYKKTNYFYRPMNSSRNVWSFHIYKYYTDRSHMYSNRPKPYQDYKGPSDPRKSYSPPARPYAGKEMRKQQKINPHSNHGRK